MGAGGPAAAQDGADAGTGGELPHVQPHRLLYVHRRGEVRLEERAPRCAERRRVGDRLAGRAGARRRRAGGAQGGARHDHDGGKRSYPRHGGPPSSLIDGTTVNTAKARPPPTTPSISAAASPGPECCQRGTGRQDVVANRAAGPEGSFSSAGGGRVELGVVAEDAVLVEGNAARGGQVGREARAGGRLIAQRHQPGEAL